MESRLALWRELIAEAEAYVAALETKLNITAAAVAGSVARREHQAASDIDVVIISDELPASPLDRIELLWSVDITRVEPKGYTRAEFLDRLRRRDPLICEAVNRGIPLRDPEGFLAGLRTSSPR